ncbi:hypothetical protein [Brevibacterium sp. 2SA]|uniref:hypothetical protein n=1 Tax=Brevibacterium sp. 2SA TaxID=2502198 RepID=UPI0010F9B566|nr:hypothetical protein [Brevibacterium sp. 2SA]
MTEEYVDYAGRSEPKERWLKASPLIIAGVLGVPLLALAVLFSLSIAQIAKYMFDLGTTGWDTVGIVFLSLSGALCVLLWIAFLFIGSRRRTWRWRISWAAAALLVAAALPLWWLFAGFFSGNPAPM